ncbi:MAG: hypothetical protein Q9217_005548 [Psora testacea]
MESVIFEDSPLAQYLEGEGEIDHAWTSTATSEEPASPLLPPSFAPSRLFQRHLKVRKKLPQPLKLDIAPKKGAVAQIHKTCSSAIHSHLGWTKNAHFLEQYRYVIVGSQLLSGHLNPTPYKRQYPPKPAEGDASRWQQDRAFVPTGLGLSLTALSAFVLAWSIRWLRNKVLASYSIPGVNILVLVCAIALMIIYTYTRRQWLHNLRLQAIRSASRLTTSMQEFDTATSAAITLIQEVELVSRGYYMQVMAYRHMESESNASQKQSNAANLTS